MNLHVTMTTTSTKNITTFKQYKLSTLAGNNYFTFELFFQNNQRDFLIS